jgi:repressor LexA
MLDTLRELAARHGRFPTVREIAAALRLSSPATVHAYLRRLAAGGLLEKRNRSWELVRTRLRVPLVGLVPAGSPLEIFETLGEEVDLPAWMAEKSGEVVALRVRGQSMKDAYIQDGDLVLIRRSERAEAGQMVVARLPDGSITLKRLKRLEQGYCLMPENPEYSAIHGPFAVVGRVVGVLRKYR